MTFQTALPDFGTRLTDRQRRLFRRELERVYDAVNVQIGSGELTRWREGVAQSVRHALHHCTQHDLLAPEQLAVEIALWERGSKDRSLFGAESRDIAGTLYGAWVVALEAAEVDPVLFDAPGSPQPSSEPRVGRPV